MTGHSSLPMVTTGFPNVDVTELRLLDQGDGTIWFEGKNWEPTENFLCSISEFSMGRFHVESDIAWMGWAGRPWITRSSVSLLSTRHDLWSPLDQAWAFYNTFLVNKGGIPADTRHVFMEPVLTSFRAAIEAESVLRPILDWVDRHDWSAIMHGATTFDMAAGAVLAGHATVEWEDQNTPVIRLREALAS
ncbi:hypothetical protein [Gluconacetobacter sacchari]|uniref:Uncharacterized protein n=1 Tax=Gluconacetobacter sacchari TaxID=92759 RepID=A0A7W4NLE6_9PROT|nr:hypothetical protein [Gluconacetobacter sacchari]MBB2159944.1 hypothetical protein [Gluconacetobacter sacchari]